MNTTDTQPSTPDTQPAPAGLTHEKFQRLCAAYGRLGELTKLLASPLITPETETLKAEKAGLEKFVSVQLLAHAAELLGCYNIVHTEYQVILKSLAIVARRIGIAPIPEEVNETVQ